MSSVATNNSGYATASEGVGNASLRPRVFTFSGKLGSGKDTVAPLVAQRFGFDEDHQIHLSFAEPLKNEITTLMNVMSAVLIKDVTHADSVDKAILQELKGNTEPANFGKSTKESATGKVTPLLPTLEDIHGLSELLVPEVVRGLLDGTGIPSGYERTDAMRAALQYWGTNVRRRLDPDYWVKKTKTSLDILMSMFPESAILITDARFPNELDFMKQYGPIVRLDASEDERIRRVEARDHVRPTREALTHDSETAADDYKDWSVFVNTDDMSIDDEVDFVMATINS